MRRAGVGDDRPVVAYDQGEPGGAARAWWLLGWFGHPDARVLDGGLGAWVAAGLPLTTETADPDPGDFTARPGGRSLLDAAGAARLAAAGVLLDARAPARYQGLEEPVDPVAGHIPGARNAPMADLVGDHGLVPPASLRRLLDRHGARPGTPVGAYCGSGVVAAHLVLACEVAGIPASLYAGSWSDWVDRPLPPGRHRPRSRDRRRPAARGRDRLRRARRSRTGGRRGRGGRAGGGGRGRPAGRAAAGRLRRDLCLAPGFVDTHAHSDLVHLLDEPQPFKLLQGVTTEVVGNCGLTFAPLDPASAEVAATLWSSLAGGCRSSRPGSGSWPTGWTGPARPTTWPCWSGTGPCG